MPSMAILFPCHDPQRKHAEFFSQNRIENNSHAAKTKNPFRFMFVDGNRKSKQTASFRSVSSSTTLIVSFFNHVWAVVILRERPIKPPKIVFSFIVLLRSRTRNPPPKRKTIVAKQDGNDS